MSWDTATAETIHSLLTFVRIWYFELGLQCSPHPPQPLFLAVQGYRAHSQVSHDPPDWLLQARFWVQVMRDLRNGVKLKKVQERRYDPLPIEFQLTPYEMLMEDIRGRRYTLRRVMVSGPTDHTLGLETRAQTRTSTPAERSVRVWGLTLSRLCCVFNLDKTWANTVCNQSLPPAWLLQPTS